jgi:apolipoprotein D and lipocalin family protein
MKITFWFSFIFIVITEGAFSQSPGPMEKLDIDRYLGLWYEVAAYRGGFNKECRCITVEYDVVPNKKYLSVTNHWIRFRHNRSRIFTAEGKMFYKNEADHTRLMMQHHWPFRHESYVMGLADDYSWVVLSHPKQKRIWILSRDPSLTPEVNDKIMELIANKGFDVKKIMKTSRNCDTPK